MKKVSIKIPSDIYDALVKESALGSLSLDELITQKIDNATNQGELFRDFRPALELFKDFLSNIPSVKNVAIPEDEASNFWWIKFQIDVNSEISWNVVQEIGHVLNYLSVDERLPVKFYPVSPPPYMNGGPEDFLSWIIEPDIPFLNPEYIINYLKSRLPDPIDDIDEWIE